MTLARLLFPAGLAVHAAVSGLPLRAVTARGPLPADEQATIDLFKQATRSVVYVTNIGLARDAYTLDEIEYPQGAGSGFVWDEGGHVVTNFHVVRGGAELAVTLADHSTYKARVVGVYPDKDVAVLKIDAPKGKLRPIPLGTSRDLQVGQKVLAIGNPFGLDQTLTTGIVSALGREIQSITRRPITGVIQTDAAINPGNSGGPLLDSAGRLVGVNTAIYSPSGASAGVGFAIPVDIVSAVVPQLIAHGRIIRPGLGIGIIDDSVTREAGMEGVLVGQVSLAAARAGLRPTRQDVFGRVLLGDLIVGLDDKPVSDSDDLFRALDGKAVGQAVTLTVVRDGRKESLQLRLQPLD